jgi:hypothetical protein
MSALIKPTYHTAVDGYIESLGKAVRALRNDLLESHPSGTLTFYLELPTRMDADPSAVPVCEIRLTFYHYSIYDTNSVTVKGMEWDEVRDEFLRRLGRDRSLKRLAHQKGQVED